MTWCGSAVIIMNRWFGFQLKTFLPHNRIKKMSFGINPVRVIPSHYRMKGRTQMSTMKM
jgi:hypothetical protein